MASYPKFEEALYANKGVTGLPDTPGLSAGEMQKKFDELSKDVIIPFINEHIDALNGEDASTMLGAKPTTNMSNMGVTSNKLQDILEALDNMTHTSISGAVISVDPSTGHLIVSYPDGTRGDLGAITFVPKGAFSATTQYEKFNLVLYTDGNTYAAIDNPPLGTLPTNTTYWTLFIDSASATSAFDTRIGDVETDVSNIKDELAISVYGTLAAGDTSITLESNLITATSIIDGPWYDIDPETTIAPIAPLTVKPEVGKITYTFNARETDLVVGIKIS